MGFISIVYNINDVAGLVSPPVLIQGFETIKMYVNENIYINTVSLP
jgi:hypothetical protein